MAIEKTMSSPVLLSIKPRYWRMVLDGVKKFEYRRVNSSIVGGSFVYVYVSGSMKMVCGSFIAGKIMYGNAQELALLEESVCIQNEVLNYLGDTLKGTAIEVTSLQEFNPPRTISEYGVNRPPQSYCFLTESQ